MGAPKINEKETIIKPDDGLYGAGRKGAELRAIDNTQHGRRTVIPITGGTFEGPTLKGTILNGGADIVLLVKM